MRAIKGRNNRTTELKCRLALVRAGISGWTVRPSEVVGNPDFLFPKYRLAVFVDGCFWHGCPVCHRIPKTNSEFWRTKIIRNRAKDEAATQALVNIGTTVLRFWEHQLSNELGRCMGEILAYLLFAQRCLGELS